MPLERSKRKAKRDSLSLTDDDLEYEPGQEQAQLNRTDIQLRKAAINRFLAGKIIREDLYDM